MRRNVLGTVLGATLLAGCGLAGLSSTATGPLQTYRAVRAAAPLSIFAEPETGNAPIVRAIQQATKSIKLGIYLFSDQDPSCQQIEQALIAAAKKGRKVQVMLNPHFYSGNTPPVPVGPEVIEAMGSNPEPSYSPNSGVFQRLSQGGVQVAWSNPAFAITHEKVMVIDNQQAFVMTTNFTRPAVSGTGSIGSDRSVTEDGSSAVFNREFDVIDRDPADVTALAQCFDADWARKSYTPPSDGPLVISPVTSRPKLEALLASAKTSVTSYQEELNDPEMLAAFAAVANKGQNVRLLIPDPAKLSPTAKHALANTVATLNKAGAQVHQPGSADLYIHAKTITVDGQQTYVGSINVSTYSLDKNREVGLITADAGVTDLVSRTFESDWKASKPIAIQR